MDKLQIISFIEAKLKEGVITKEEILHIGEAPGSIPYQPNVSISNIVTVGEGGGRTNMTNVFYGIGAIIALVGVVILVQQNWETIGFGGRIMVTLGLSLVTYIAALVLNSPSQSKVSQVMFTISAVLAPLGIYILLDEANIEFTRWIQFFASVSLCLFYGVAYMISKKNMLVILLTWFGSWAYYSIIFQILGSMASYDLHLLEWSTMFLGLAHILIAFGFVSTVQDLDSIESKEKVSIANVLYGFGTLGILSAGIYMGGIFDLLFIGVLFLAFYGSVYFKSRAMLIFSALFLMAHIGKITGKYFAGSIGWPLALIIVGFLVIGVGYMSFGLNKKYFNA